MLPAPPVRWRTESMEVGGFHHFLKGEVQKLCKAEGNLRTHCMKQCDVLLKEYVSFNPYIQRLFFEHQRRKKRGDSRYPQACRFSRTYLRVPSVWSPYFANASRASSRATSVRSDLSGYNARQVCSGIRDRTPKPERGRNKSSEGVRNISPASSRNPERTEGRQRSPELIRYRSADMNPERPLYSSRNNRNFEGSSYRNRAADRKPYHNLEGRLKPSSASPDGNVGKRSEEISYKTSDSTRYIHILSEENSSRSSCKASKEGLDNISGSGKAFESSLQQKSYSENRQQNKEEVIMSRVRTAPSIYHIGIQPESTSGVSRVSEISGCLQEEGTHCEQDGRIFEESVEDSPQLNTVERELQQEERSQLVDREGEDIPGCSYAVEEEDITNNLSSEGSSVRGYQKLRSQMPVYTTYKLPGGTMYTYRKPDLSTILSEAKQVEGNLYVISDANQYRTSERRVSEILQVASTEAALEDQEVKSSGRKRKTTKLAPHRCDISELVPEIRRTRRKSFPNKVPETRKYTFYKYYGFAGQGAKTSWVHNRPLGLEPPYAKRASPPLTELVI